MVEFRVDKLLRAWGGAIRGIEALECSSCDSDLERNAICYRTQHLNSAYNCTPRVSNIRNIQDMKKYKAQLNY